MVFHFHIGNDTDDLKAHFNGKNLFSKQCLMCALHEQRFFFQMNNALCQPDRKFPIDWKHFH